MSGTPRDSRIAFGQPNHIICRGNNRRRLFSYPHEYLSYLRLLHSALSKDQQFALHALCLMSNHVHLLITPPSVAAISRLMQKVNQRYAQMRNKARGGSGKLFEQGFQSIPVETEEHLAFCVLYIDANPRTAHVANHLEYPWSSEAFHSGRGKNSVNSMIQVDSWYLSLGGSPIERSEVYRTLFTAYLDGEANCEFLEMTNQMLPPASHRKRLERPNGSSAAEPEFAYRNIVL